MFVDYIPQNYWIIYLIVLVIGMFILSRIDDDPVTGDSWIILTLAAIIFIIFVVTFTSFIDNWVELYGDAPTSYWYGSAGATIAALLTGSVFFHSIIIKSLRKRKWWFLFKLILFAFFSILIHSILYVSLVFFSVFSS